jgi:hypothetical protein
MADPVGQICPACGEPPRFLLGGGTQAFCGTDDCPVFTWDPTKTRAELNASMTVIDLSDMFPDAQQDAPPSRNPAAHPGQDTITVIYPDIDRPPPPGTDLLAWCEEHWPGVRHDEVTRDEFTRRMAGDPVLGQLHEAGRDTRVVTLMSLPALTRWLETRDA